MLLAGCQTLDSRLPADWVMQGAMIIRTADRAERINIAWRQAGDESEILLTGPLGASIARITPVEGGYILRRPGEEDLSAASLENLVSLAIGQPLPVSAVVPVLAGDKRNLKSGPWRLETSEVDASGRAKKIRITGEAIAIVISVREWG